MFKYTYAVLRSGPKIIYSYFAWMRKYSNHPEKYPIEERYFKLQKLLKHVLVSLKCDIHIENEDNILDGTNCFISDHLSMFDPLIYFSFMKKPCSIVAKKEAESYPFIGRCIKLLDGEFIDRNDLKQSLKLMMRVQDDLAKGTKNWLIFPEGTRNKMIKGNLPAFHSGTFRAPTRAGVNIIPISLYGSFRIGQIKPQFKKNPIYIEFGKPLTKDDYSNLQTEEVADIIHDRVAENIYYKARLYDHKEMLKLKDKKYRFNAIKG